MKNNERGDNVAELMIYDSTTDEEIMRVAGKACDVRCGHSTEAEHLYELAVENDNEYGFFIKMNRSPQDDTEMMILKEAIEAANSGTIEELYKDEGENRYEIFIDATGTPKVIVNFL